MQMNLRQKRMVIVAATLVAFSISTLSGWYLNRHVERQIEAIRDRYIPFVDTGYRLRTLFEKMNLGFRDAVAVQDPNQLTLLQEAKTKLLSELNSTVSIVDSAQVEDCKRALEDYFSYASKTSLRLIEGETGLSIVEEMTEMQSKRAKAESLLKRVAFLDRERITEAFSLISSEQQQGETARFWVNALCTLLISLISIATVRGVMRSLEAIRQGLARFGQGDFRTPIHVIGSDELSVLSRQINSMAERIQALVREIESFSYSIAHDLRAPVRSIHGFSAALLEDDEARLSEEGKSSLNRIISAAQRMGEMVDGLLSLSRVNRTPINKQDVDLSKVANRLIDDLKSSDSSRNVTFRADQNIHAQGDPRLLDAVLANLLSNAWKFTKHRPHANIHFGMK
ncbi:MAG: HAMP domain-containing sensor histidine kinase, partial [Bdellovibrionota bacterium]